MGSVQGYILQNRPVQVVVWPRVPIDLRGSEARTRVHCFETDLASDPVNSVLSPYTCPSSLNYRPKYGWKASGDVGCPPLLDVVVGPATGQTAGGRVRSRRQLCDCPLLGRVEAESVGRRREGPERVRGADSEGQETARLPSRSVCKQDAEGGRHVGRLR